MAKRFAAYLSWIHTLMQNVFSLLNLLHTHFCFWGHERLTDRSISKRYPKSDATPWAEKKFNFKSVSRSWHIVLLVIWKRSAWAFIAKQWCLSLNGNTISSPLSVETTLALYIYSSINSALIFEVYSPCCYHHFISFYKWHQSYHRELQLYCCLFYDLPR